MTQQKNKQQVVEPANGRSYLQNKLTQPQCGSGWMVATGHGLRKKTNHQITNARCNCLKQKFPSVVSCAPDLNLRSFIILREISSKKENFVSDFFLHKNTFEMKTKKNVAIAVSLNNSHFLLT